MKDIEQAGQVLGKRIDAPKSYDPSILVRVARSNNREQYDIKEANLPFFGWDVWNAYELSFLTNNGLPIALVGKIVYSASNLYIVESKSLKLYLNSFNMTKSKYSTRKDTIEWARDTIQQDLSKLLETEVAVNFFDTEENTKPVFENCCLLEHSVPYLDSIKFTHFQETPELLIGKWIEDDYILRVKCNLLRSNCRITHQPDWGTLYINIHSNFDIDKTALLKYIVSFRNENHFHEEVVEMIFKRMYDKFSPLDLMVSAIYTRRGGIDICPIRTTNALMIDSNLINPAVHCAKILRQ